MPRPESVLRLRDFRLAAGARAISALGDAMAMIALLLRVHDGGEGPWAVSLVLVAAAAPLVLLAGWAGRISDTYDSRRVLVLCAALQGAGCLALAAGGPLGQTLVLVLIVQAGQAVAGPTWQALVPAMVGPARTGAAVGVMGSLTTGAEVAGPALAGILTGVGGAGLPLVADGLTFLALGLAALCVRTRRGGASPTSTRRRTPRGDSGLAVLRADAILWPLALGLMAFVLVAEGTNVVDVFLVRDALGAGSAAYGGITAVMMTGVVVGSLLGARPDDRSRVRRVVMAAVVLSSTLVLSGLAPSILVLAPVAAALGVANGVLNTQGSALMLTRLPEAALGRGAAAMNGLVRAGSVVGLGLGGVVGGICGPRWTFVGCGLLALLATAGLAWRLRSAGAVGRGAAAAQHVDGRGQDRDDHDADQDDVEVRLDVMADERDVAQGVAEDRHAAGPDEAPDRAEGQVHPAVHAPHARGHRDEGPHDRHEAREDHGGGSVPIEERVRALDVVLAEQA
jgi:MFS family permease